MAERVVDRFPVALGRPVRTAGLQRGPQVIERPLDVVASLECGKRIDVVDRTNGGHGALYSGCRGRGAVGPHRRWLSDNEARQHLRARWAEFFHDFDVLLCPIMPTAAFPHDHRPFEARTLEVDGQEIRYMDQVFWAGLITVAYLPSTVAPVGRTPEGLPVGMQIVAPYLEDRTAIHFARLIEDLVGGFEAPPGYAD